jgi:hypothetical protein
MDQPASPSRQSHLVITTVDVAMGFIAVVLAVGLVVGALLSRDIPAYLVAVFAQIIAYYFGRTART